MMGMSTEEYWEKDCRLAQAFQKAYKMKVNEVSRNAWLQGQYVLSALQCGVPVGFIDKKRGGSSPKYPKEPYKVYQDKVEEKKPKQAEMRNVKGIAWMQAMAEAINRNIRKKQDSEPPKSSLNKQ